MGNASFNFDERAFQEYVDKHIAVLNSEIKKEIDRENPTDRAGLERIVKAATARATGLKYPPDAQKSIVDQWVKNLGW